MKNHNSFLKWYQGQADKALQNNERRLVILSGQEAWALSLLKTIELISDTLADKLLPANTSSCLIFGDSTVIRSNVSKNRFRDKLGSESDVIIFADSEFTIDAFAALSGTLKAGGVFFLVMPFLPEQMEKSHFIRRFYSFVQQHSSHTIINESASNEWQLLESDSQNHFNQNQTHNHSDNKIEMTTVVETDDSFKVSTISSPELYRQECITKEQYSAVKAIIKVVTGHRKRPLVLTADRGRGKSSALAIACAELMKTHEHNDFSVVISAPDIQSLSIFYQQLSQSLQTSERNSNSITYGKSRLTFVPVDQLIKQSISCNLLMIDEAAAIPVYLLEQLLGLYSRLVFSSTVHGYEGAGRGFTLKFKKVLDSLCPQWANLHINQAIRWRNNDPLEHLVFSTCLLNAELPELKNLPLIFPESTVIENATSYPLGQLLNRFEFKMYTAEELACDESLLKQVFSVLVTAHYQTKPSDLMLLLDNKQVQVACLLAIEHNQSDILAVALLMKEGSAVEVNREDVLDVKQSKRRLRDHFLPQSLLTHCGFEPAFDYSFLRILRIAVHPKLHQKGIGSYFINKIESYAKTERYDFIGASFGANAELLSYWLKAGFTVVRLGFTKDKASGEHSALVLKGLKSELMIIERQFSTEFYRSFDYLLLDEYKLISPELIHIMLMHNLPANIPMLSELDTANVKAYAVGERLFSSCVYSLYLWFKHDLLSKRDVESKKQLDNKIDMELVLIARLIQKHDTQTVCQQFGFTGKKMLNKAIMSYVAMRLTCN